jgi:hypothetical protein
LQLWIPSTTKHFQDLWLLIQFLDTKLLATCKSSWAVQKSPQPQKEGINTEKKQALMEEREKKK